MPKAKFWHGRWVVTGDGEVLAIDYDDPPPIVCNMNFDSEFSGSIENGYLIEAAPDLYEALRDILMCIETDALIPESVSYMRQARAALALAHGKRRKRELT